MAYQQQPTLHLNPLPHEGKTFIKFYYKADTLIQQKLKSADWIKYSQTYKCYVMAHSTHTLEKTYRHFGSEVRINTHYLNRPPRLRPTTGATILAGAHPSEPLAKKAALTVVQLFPLLQNKHTLIALQCKLNQALTSKLKESKICKWSEESKCFVMPVDNKALHTLLDELHGLAHIWLCQTLTVKEIPLLIRLWQQSYSQAPGFISCPVGYLEKLFLLHYSLHTIRTYHSLLVRFLNGHQEAGIEKMNAFSPVEINHYHRGMVQSNRFSYSLINQSINAVKFYYQRVLGRNEVRLENVERPEKAFTLPKVLNKPEVAKILNATENLKHRCLMQLLYAGGLRIGEVINLKISDVNTSKNDLYINALEWMNRTYKSGKSVIQTTDKDGGMIIGKAVSQTLTYNNMGIKNDGGYFSYIFSIYCKDNKYKYTIDNIIYNKGEMILTPGADLAEEFPHNWTGLIGKNKQTRREWKSFQRQADKEFKVIIDSLKKHMGESKKNSDW